MLLAVQMERMLIILAAGLGGWIGWAVGDLISLFVAVLLGAVGTGAGVWAARHLTQELS